MSDKLLLPPAGHPFEIPGPTDVSAWVQVNCLLVTRKWLSDKEAEIECLKGLLQMAGYQYVGADLPAQQASDDEDLGNHPLVADELFPAPIERERGPRWVAAIRRRLQRRVSD